MRRLSNVRLGCCLGIIKTIPLQQVNRLFHGIQSGHLQNAAESTLSPIQSQEARAVLVRRCLDEC